MPSLRLSKDIRRSREMAWLVGTETVANVSFMETLSSISFSLSVPTSFAPGLHGQLVLLFNSLMETFWPSIPSVLWGRNYVFSFHSQRGSPLAPLLWIKKLLVYCAWPCLSANNMQKMNNNDLGLSKELPPSSLSELPQGEALEL